jgi:hypothetical protein
MIPVRENSEVVIIYPVYIDEYSTFIYIYGKWSIEIDSLPVKIGGVFHGKLLVITRWQPLKKPFIPRLRWARWAAPLPLAARFPQLSFAFQLRQLLLCIGGFLAAGIVLVPIIMVN